MNRGGCKAPVLESCRMACTAKCDSCKSSCVRPAASLPTARRRSTSLKLSQVFRKGVGFPTARWQHHFVRTARSSPDLTGHCAAANRSRSGNALSRRCITRNFRPSQAGFPPHPTTELSCNCPRGSRVLASGKSHRPERVMASTTSARLHTTKRDWQRTVGQGGGVSAERTPSHFDGRKCLCSAATREQSRVAPLLLL